MKHRAQPAVTRLFLLVFLCFFSFKLVSHLPGLPATLGPLETKKALRLVFGLIFCLFALNIYHRFNKKKS
ncbi:MAG: hypothetical protein MI784_04000 [Cytophagales bacterium]|nr:hypothetical protein [Cytophagales bacterium]